MGKKTFNGRGWSCIRQAGSGTTRAITAARPPSPCQDRAYWYSTATVKLPAYLPAS